MIINDKCLEFFQIKLVNVINYLVDISSTRKIIEITPKYQYLNIKPTVEHLCILGFLAYLYTLKEKYTKLKNKINC